MRIGVADAETFYSADFTLTRLTTEEYIRSPIFDAHGFGFCWQDGTREWVGKSRLRSYLASIDWDDTALIAHHANFDGLILSHHFGVRPKFWFCTLSMARLLIGNHLSVGLDNLARHFGLKGKTLNYNMFRGKHWEELLPHEQIELGEGCLQDCEIEWRLFELLTPQVPLEELEVIDRTIRMFTEPSLQADTDLLAQVWETEAKTKQSRLDALQIGVSELQSADKFAALLEAEGVEIEYKDGKSGPIPAFAKNDEFMRNLQESDNERVRALAEARLGAKSTLLQTRAETLGYMSNRGPLTVYLRYCGAHTTRWSGGDGSNFQNFKRGSDIRRAIRPPDGYTLVTIDLSQIECRLLNYLAGQQDKVADFREGRDPYIGVASAFYGYQVTKEAHPTERQVGKVLELQCGYGSGAKKIQATLRIAGIVISDERAIDARNAYRGTHPAVVQYWSTAAGMLGHLKGGSDLEWGPMRIKDHTIVLPNGAPLVTYKTLEWHNDRDDPDATGWRLKTRNGWTRIWGSKLVENVVQALARVVISQALLRITKLGYRVVSTEHDSLWILIPQDGRQEQHIETCKTEMTRVPAWLPSIPLGCEATVK